MGLRYDPEKQGVDRSTIRSRGKKVAKTLGEAVDLERDKPQRLRIARGDKALAIVARQLGGARVDLLEHLEAGTGEVDDFSGQQLERIEAWILEQSTATEEPAAEAAAEAQDDADQAVPASRIPDPSSRPPLRPRRRRKRHRSTRQTSPGG